MSQVKDVPKLNMDCAISRVTARLTRMPKRTRAIRLVVPVKIGADDFCESLLRTQYFPQVAWYAGEKSAQGVAAGDSGLSPLQKSAPLVHLAESEQPLPKSLPWAWQFAPFDTKASIRQTPPWGLIEKGLDFVPRILLWRNESSAWLVYTGAPNESETARGAALRLVTEASNILQRLLRAKRSTFKPVPPPLENQGHDPDNFRERVANLKKEFQKKNLAKVVLARATAHAAPTQRHWDVLSTYRQLVNQNSKATVFLCRRGMEEAFLGATPETLCEVKNRRLTTHAVAGTAPRGRTPNEDAFLGRKLSESEKDRHEHALVVTHLRRKLKSLTQPAGLQVAATPTLLKLPYVQHLATAVKGQLLPDVTALDVARALHPTPAVCGVPTDSARRYLRHDEPFSRGLYAGFAGWQSDRGDGEFVVTIRSMLLTSRDAFIFAGAGIVPDSSPELEDEETKLKARGAARALVATPDFKAQGS